MAVEVLTTECRLTETTCAIIATGVVTGLRTVVRRSPAGGGTWWSSDASRVGSGVTRNSSASRKASATGLHPVIVLNREEVVRGLKTNDTREVVVDHQRPHTIKTVGISFKRRLLMRATLQ